MVEQVFLSSKKGEGVEERRNGGGRMVRVYVFTIMFFYMLNLLNHHFVDGEFTMDEIKNSLKDKINSLGGKIDKNKGKIKKEQVCEIDGDGNHVCEKERSEIEKHIILIREQ